MMPVDRLIAQLLRPTSVDEAMEGSLYNMPEYQMGNQTDAGAQRVGGDDVAMEELIQLIGDVKPLRPFNTQEAQNAIQRMMEPSYFPGSQGQRSIDIYGGRRSPRLDLMDVLTFPGKGGQLR